MKAACEVICCTGRNISDRLPLIPVAIMGMMSLKLQKGEDVTIVADGQDEDAAVSGVATFLGA